jgi:hypothetical protein
MGAEKEKEKAMDEGDYARDEFLHFLTEIYDAGTGVLCVDRLVVHLDLSPAQIDSLAEAGFVRGRAEVKTLVDLLEVVYDRLGTMDRTVKWFGHARLAALGGDAAGVLFGWKASDAATGPTARIAATARP